MANVEEGVFLSNPPEVRTSSSASEAGSKLVIRPPGIDSRETVLLQSRNLAPSEIITLDTDDDEDDQIVSKSSLQNQSAKSISCIQTDVGSIANRSTSTAMHQIMRAVEQSDLQNATSKKRLFSSTEAIKNMSRSSGLPSPPTSGGNSPKPDWNDLSPSRSISTLRPTRISKDKRPDNETDYEDGDFSIHYARLLGSSNPHFDAAEDLCIKPVDTNNTLHKARTISEAQGVTKSQRLRAQRQLQLRAQKSQSRVSMDGGKEALARAFRYDSPNIEDIWHARDEALGIAQPVGQANSIEVPFAGQVVNTIQTQNHPSSGDKENVNNAAKSEERARNRLARIRENAHRPWNHSKRKPANDANTEPNERSEKRMRFHAPELSHAPRLTKTASGAGGARNPTTTCYLRGVPFTRSASPVQVSETADLTDEPRSAGASSLNSPSSNLSILQQLCAPSSALKNKFEKRLQGPSNHELYPEQGVDWKPPPGFETWTTDRQRNIERRGVLKQRLRHLELIPELFKLLAQLYVTCPSRGGDTSKLMQIRDFAEAILVYKKSGSRAQGKLKSIKSQIVERIRDSGEEPDANTVDKKILEIMPQHIMNLLQHEIPRVKAELSATQVVCSNYCNSSYYRTRQTQRTAVKNTSMSQIGRLRKSRDTYERSQCRQIEDLRSQLAMFKDKAGGLPTADDGIQSRIIDSDLSASDAESVISEETDGNDFMASIKFQALTKPRIDTSQPTLKQSDAEESETQTAQTNGPVLTRAAQAPDQFLLEKMTAKTRQQNQLDEQEIQRHEVRLSQGIKDRKTIRKALESEFQDIAKFPTNPRRGSTFNIGEDANETSVECEKEFDDSDLDDESDSEPDEFEDHQGQPACRRYIVKSSMMGLGPDYDVTEHIVNKFLRRENAKKSVLGIGSWFQEEFIRRHPNTTTDGREIILTDSEREYEQRISVGENKQVGCRTWIEEEMYNPSEEAYENAKVKQACKPPQVWFVDWEKTIKPVKDTSGEGEEGGGEGGDDDQEDSNAGHTDGENTSDSSSNADCQTASDTQDPANEDFADLFESPTPETIPMSAPMLEQTQVSNVPAAPAVPSPVVERPTFDTFRLFTNLAEANRQAKMVFMQWFTSRLRGAGNIDYISLEDVTMEEQLKRIGDRDLWERQEELEVDRDGMKMTETLRVWVRKAKSSGCSN